MTVLILILMLLSVNTLLVIRVLTREAITSIKSQIDVSVYFENAVSQQSIDEVISFVTSFPEVIGTEYQSKEQVLEAFKKTHENDKHISEALAELKENPLGAVLIIQTRDPAEYKNIIDALSVPEYEDIIEAKTFDDTEKAIERIDMITKQVERLSYALTIFFAVIAFLIIFNTIRVAIYTQRIEIAIKKLVGATDWFIRGPYIVEAFLFSVLSTFLTAVIVFFAFRVLDPYVAAVFEQPSILTQYFFSHILLLLGGQFMAVLFLTIMTSFLAMRRHLRV